MEIRNDYTSLTVLLIIMMRRRITHSKYTRSEHVRYLSLKKALQQPEATGIRREIIQEDALYEKLLILLPSSIFLPLLMWVTNGPDHHNTLGVVQHTVNHHDGDVYYLTPSLTIKGEKHLIHRGTKGERGHSFGSYSMPSFKIKDIWCK